MERIKNLDRYQKGILAILTVMAVIFAGVYAVVTSQIGYPYNGQILKPGTENGNTVYQAKVDDEEWCFTVTPDNTVTFRCGEKNYGPYTANIDPTAVPKDNDLAKYMTGIEIRVKDEVFFRGGIMGYGEYGDTHQSWMIYKEDGTWADIRAQALTSNGTVIYGDGVDPMEPSVSNILRLMQGPELTRKGEWYAWIAGVFICLITAVSILFAEEMFRMKLAFRVRDVELVEPSDWEITCRYIAWTLMTVMALAVFFTGLE